jgi:hypothetical protein
MRVPFDARDGGLVHVGVGVSMLPVHGRPIPGAHAAAEFPVTRVKRRKERNGFRQSGADGETRYTHESAAARYCIKCKPTHPSPSAHEFRLLLNGLATSALRRMVWPFRIPLPVE